MPCPSSLKRHTKAFASSPLAALCLLSTDCLEYLDQLPKLAPLLLRIAGGNRFLHAIVRVALKDEDLNLGERHTDRHHLIEAVDTVAVLFDHFRNPAQLALDAREPLKSGLLFHRSGTSPRIGLTGCPPARFAEGIGRAACWERG